MRKMGIIDNKEKERIAAKKREKELAEAEKDNPLKNKELIEDFYSQIYQVRAREDTKKRNKNTRRTNTHFGFYGYVKQNKRIKPDPKDGQITVKDVQGLLKKR